MNGKSGHPESVGGLLRHTSIYAIAPLFQRALALVLVRYYTKALGAGPYGLLSLVDLFIALLPLIAGTSLVAGLSRHYFVHEDRRDRSSVVSGSALVLLGTSIVGVALVLLLREPIAALLFATRDAAPPAEFVHWIVIAACVVPFSLMTRVGIEALQVEKQSRTVVSITVSKAVVESALKLVLLFVFDMGVSGFLLAVLAGEAVTGTLLFAHVVRTHGLRLDPKTFGPVLRYTLPLVPVGLFQMGLHQSDRFLIKQLGPDSVVGETAAGSELTVTDSWLGIYGLGYQIPFLLHTASISSFMRIWKPSLFGIKDAELQRNELRRVGTLVVVGLATVYGLLAIYGREAVHLLAGEPALRAGAEVVPWIATAYLGYALYSLAQAALMVVYATSSLAVINLAALVANLLLNIALIPRFGYMGAAGATLLSFLLLAALGYARSAARSVRPFPVGHALLALMAVAAAGTLGRAIDGVTAPWSIPAMAAKALAIALVAAGLFASLPAEMRNGAIQRLRDRFRR